MARLPRIPGSTGLAIGARGASQNLISSIPGWLLHAPTNVCSGCCGCALRYLELGVYPKPYSETWAAATLTPAVMVLSAGLAAGPQGLLRTPLRAFGRAGTGEGPATGPGAVAALGRAGGRGARNGAQLRGEVVAGADGECGLGGCPWRHDVCDDR